MRIAFSVFYIAALVAPIAADWEYWPLTGNSLFDLRLKPQDHFVARLDLPAAGKSLPLPMHASVEAKLHSRSDTRAAYLLQFARSNLPFSKFAGQVASLSITDATRDSDGNFIKEERKVWEGIL